MLVDEEAGGKSVKGNHTGTAIPHADSQKHPRSPKYVAHVWAHSAYMMAGFLGMAPATLLSAGWSLTVERYAGSPGHTMTRTTVTPTTTAAKMNGPITWSVG